MKTSHHLKKPFGTTTMVPIRGARYLAWEDAFDVEFEDGLSFLEPHKTVRRANKISAKAEPVGVEVDLELRSHFVVTYNTGERAEVSWEFVRERPPAKR